MTKKEAISHLSLMLMNYHIDSLHGNYSDEQLKIKLEELEIFAESNNIPFCWELHKEIMDYYPDQQSYLRWKASGC